MVRRLLLLAPVVLTLVGLAAARPPAAVGDRAKGREFLETTAFIRGFWPEGAYDSAWKSWGVAERPADYDAAFRDRYGLSPAPYRNNGLPMGLRRADVLLGPGIGIDCLTCHGGSVNGKSVVGLGNSSLDIHSLFTEMTAATGGPSKASFQFSQARGTSEAGAFSVYLLGLRNPDLTLRFFPKDLGLADDSCEDPPAWWLLKKKRTMYHTGTTGTDSHRSLMQFMMHPLTTRGEFVKLEPKFQDLRAYLLSLEAPKYPYPVDQKLADAGRSVFAANCASCHGSYGDTPTYPNKVVPVESVGTDRKRYDNIRGKFADAYNASWFAEGGHPVADTKGYQAPPLDGVWATAPYLHNGSAPTLAAVLDSAARPNVFTRSFRTAEEDYDKERVGWKTREVPPPGAKTSGHERRKVYDTTQPGRSNAGHTYGDDLTAEERRAVVEYLKTL